MEHVYLRQRFERPLLMTHFGLFGMDDITCSGRGTQKTLSMHSRACQWIYKRGAPQWCGCSVIAHCLGAIESSAAEFPTGCTRMMLGSDLPLAVIMVGKQGAPGQGEAPLDGFNLCLPCRPCNSFASINATDHMQAKALSALTVVVKEK